MNAIQNEFLSAPTVSAIAWKPEELVGYRQFYFPPDHLTWLSERAGELCFPTWRLSLWIEAAVLIELNCQPDGCLLPQLHSSHQLQRREVASPMVSLIHNLITRNMNSMTWRLLSAFEEETDRTTSRLTATRIAPNFMMKVDLSTQLGLCSFIYMCRLR